MEKIYSKIKENKLLHMVHRANEFYTIEDGVRRDVVGEKEFIQLSALNMDKGHTFKPHKHIWKPGEKKVIAQESWIVAKGKIRVFYYDTDGSLLSTEDLGQGDCSITYEGGHTYMALEEDTFVYENKVGPYKGIENDKKLL